MKNQPLFTLPFFLISLVLLVWCPCASLLLAQTAPSPTPAPAPLVNTPAPTPTPDISAMVARLKAAKATNKPFVIYYNVGKQVTVAGGSYLALNPSGKFTNIVVFTEDDTTNLIPVYLITKLTLVTNFPFD